MTKYNILVVTNGLVPVTYQHAGQEIADSKEQAVRQFRDSMSLRDIENQFDSLGSGNIVDVVAIPDSNFSKFEIDYSDNSVNEKDTVYGQR